MADKTRKSSDPKSPIVGSGDLGIGWRAPDPLDELRREVEVAEYTAQRAEEARRLRSRLAELKLRPRAKQARERAAAVRPAEAARSELRRRGRPKGSRTHRRDTIVDTFRRLRQGYGRRPTQSELVVNLDPRIGVRTLQEHLRDYRLPWPIE